MKGKRGPWPDADKPADTADKPKPGDAAGEAPTLTPEQLAELAGKPAPAAAAPADTTLRHQPSILTKESVKHTFTVAELAEIADKMALAGARVYQIEKEKAEQAAHYSAELKAANLATSDLVAKYNQRYEMRDVECRIEYDRPEVGYKAYVRTDNGEVVREVMMTDAEKQRAFVFDPGDGKPQ